MTEEIRDVNNYYTQNFYPDYPVREFSGALMSISKPHTWKSTSYNMVPWDKALYNTGYWNPQYPTRLTVPKGVTKVRLAGNIIWETVGVEFQQGYRMIRMRKNGQYTAGLPYSRYMGISTSPANAMSAVIEVKEGDYFELEVYYRENKSLALRSDPYTWFSIEAVEFEKK